MVHNILLGASAYTLAAGGTCGVSALVSFPVSSPDNFTPAGGRHTLVVTNDSTTVPLHVEARAVVQDHLGLSLVVPLAVALLSNTQAFGSAQSAAQVQTLLMLLSGQNACIPLEGVVGTGIQIAVLAASNSTDTACGVVAVWRV